MLAACRKRADDVARMNELGFTGILLDLDDSASVERAAAEVIALTGGRLYGLFNNGGFGVYGPLSRISRSQLERQFATNLFGTHQLTQLLLPAMLPHGEGRIIQTSSVMGLISSAGPRRLRRQQICAGGLVRRAAHGAAPQRHSGQPD